MTFRTRTYGFSLAELLLAMGLFAIVVLTFLGLATKLLQVDSKSLETSAGSLIAEQLIQRTEAQLSGDAAARANFFAEAYDVTPWAEGQVVSDGRTFYYTVHARTVANVGTVAPSNRLKKIDFHVWWAGEDTQTRQGQGRLEVRGTQLVSEADVMSAVAP